MTRRRKMVVDIPEAHREPTTEGAQRVARERTVDILRAWHMERQFDAGLSPPERDPLRDLAESCYLQGVLDSAGAMLEAGALSPPPRMARVLPYGAEHPS